MDRRDGKNPIAGSPILMYVGIVILLILAVFGLYQAYNFVFNAVAFPTADTIIAKSIQTSPVYNGGTPSFRLPYEGGDYTISFWLYVNSNTFVNGGYRKHIVDIGGDTFSTVAIGIDAIKNSLVVRTHTGDSTASGLSSTTSVSGGGSGSAGGNYVSAGGQTFYGGVLPGSTSDPNCFSYDVTNGYTLKTGGVADTGCKTISQLTRTGGPKCTSVGLIDATDNKTNLGWDKSCNPCSGYWNTPGSDASWWSGLMGGTSSTTATYVSYTTAAPCANTCKWSEDGTFSGAALPGTSGGGSPGSPGTGSPGSPGTGSPGTGSPGKCTWSGPKTYTASTNVDVLGSSSGSTKTTYTSSSTPACAATTTLSTSTMDSLFNSAVSTSDCDPPPACDIPEFDLQRWTLVTVVLSGKITDVYLNGKLARSCVANSYFKVDTANPTAHILNYKRFDGQIANMNFYNVGLNPAQIYENYMKGPAL